MDLLHKVFGFTELREIDIQLGASIHDEPAPELKALYLQLLVGFQLISERNNYPGYALIANEGVEHEELQLVREREPSVMSIARRYNGYWRTAILSAHQKARRASAILNGRLKWIEGIDPTLYSAMKNLGKPHCNQDCANLMIQFNMEQEAKRPLMNVQAK